MTTTPLSMRLAYIAYLMLMGSATLFVILWMSSPGFRYWLFRQGRELEYRWASWEYRLRHEPVPGWVEHITQTNLPDEAARPED